MIIKLEKVINCSSEHPSYPASNLLQRRNDSSWRCAKPGEMLATVVFQMTKPSCITGLDIGNYRSCVVIVTASTSSDPDDWIPIINHQFLTHDEAADGKFKDQVQLFTKRELDPETLKIKFDRVKITCMQSSNLRELFGLSFVVLRTEVTVDLGLDVFGRFKLKRNDDENSLVDEFKEKYLKMMAKRKTDYKEELLEKAKETGMSAFVRRQETLESPKKRPLLKKLETGTTIESFETRKISDDTTARCSSSKREKAREDIANLDSMKKGKDKMVARTPFGDVIPSRVAAPKTKNNLSDVEHDNHERNAKKRPSSVQNDENESVNLKKRRCSRCTEVAHDALCGTCDRLSQPKPNLKKAEEKDATPKVLFSELMKNVSFSLSGYVNPWRDEIRKKALEMGATYIADPNTTDKRCTHLICAFRNTPKQRRLKDHSKIVSHGFIEDCYREKKRFSWRRYALDKKEKLEPESEDEIVGITRLDPFEEETDSDSNY